MKVFNQPGSPFPDCYSGCPPSCGTCLITQPACIDDHDNDDDDDDDDGVDDYDDEEDDSDHHPSSHCVVHV